MDELVGYYYSRYGVADVLAHELGASRKTAPGMLEELTEEDFKEAATRRLEALRNQIRLQFPTEGFTPQDTVLGAMVEEPDGTPGEQVSEKGFYVRPHVLLDAGALNGRYGLLNSYLPTKKALLQRFYPPATKLSIGKKSADNAQRSIPFILACQVTTLTPRKAARKSGDADRVAVIPDLPLPELVTYVRVFDWMQRKGTNPRAATVRRSGEGVNLEGNSGNFPEAPPEWAFGGLGVMAAIGTWARSNRQLTLAQPVLEVLAEQRFYVIDTSGASRVETAGRHLARLSAEHDLARILQASWKVQTNVEADSFYRVFRRWLLQWNAPTFGDFLAVRAHYPPEFAPIFEAYFMERFDPDLIDSARIAAQHVNQQAYFAADGSDPDAKRKNKQKILAGLESMLRDAANGPEMIARLSVQVGRLTGSSFPAEAQGFFDAVTSGNLDLADARNLLLAYMRLRKAPTTSADSPSPEAGAAPEEGDEATEKSPVAPGEPSSSAPGEDPLSQVESV